MQKPLRRLLIGAAALVVSSLATNTFAQAFPSRPIKLIVPYAPGGNTDIVARIFGQKLAERVGQPVVFDNRGGATGTLGVGVAAKSPNDGYTMVIGDLGSMVIANHAIPNRPYDPVRDFAPIALVSSVSIVVTVNPKSPSSNFDDILKRARAQPGKLTYGTSGIGSPSHMAMELVQSMTKAELVHVPFKGGAQAMPAVVGGEVALSFATIVSSLPLVQSGKLRGLAVTSAKRFPSAKEFPTVAESGLPGYEAVAWYGVFAPDGTPREIIQQLNTDIVRIIHAPDVRDLLLKQGADSYATSVEEFAKVVQRDVAKWAKVVKSSGAKAD